MSMFDLTETITYWERSSLDGFGGTQWAEPVTANARWARSFDRAIDDKGKEIHTTHKVYTKADIDDGAYIYLGESSASQPVSDAKEIKMIVDIPSFTDMNKYLI